MGYPTMTALVHLALSADLVDVTGFSFFRVFANPSFQPMPGVTKVMTACPGSARGFFVVDNIQVFVPTSNFHGR